MKKFRKARILAALICALMFVQTLGLGGLRISASAANESVFFEDNFDYDSFADMKIPESDGNVIFPEGNAKKYLAEYFEGDIPENPYEEDPCDVRCVSFSANGDVLDGNAYKTDVMEIISSYEPK